MATYNTNYDTQYAQLKHQMQKSTAARDTNQEQTNQYAASVLSPIRGPQRFPDSHPKATSMLTTRTDQRFTVDVVEGYSNNYMILDTVNSPIPNAQLFRLKGDTYYHISDIQMSKSLTDGRNFGPTRRTQSEYTIEPIGLAPEEFGHRGLITSVTANDFPPMLQYRSKAETIHTAGTNGIVVRDSPISEGMTMLQYPTKKLPFNNYNGFTVGQDGINAPASSATCARSIAFDVTAHPEYFETNGVSEWFKVSQQEDDPNLNSEFQNWSQQGQTYRITGNWTGTGTAADIFLQWNHARNFTAETQDAEIIVGRIQGTTATESFSFVKEVTVPSTPGFFSIVFVGNNPSQTDSGSVVIEQLNYTPGTKTTVTYLSDLHDDQVIHISGIHNHEYIPPALIADIAQPKQHSPFEENNLKHVVQLFDKLEKSQFGPAFQVKHRELINMIINSEMLTRKGIKTYRAGTFTDLFTFIKQLVTGYAPAMARGIRDVYTNAYDFDARPPVIPGVEKFLRTYRASTTSNKDDKETKDIKTNNKTSLDCGTVCDGSLVQMTEAMITIEGTSNTQRAGKIEAGILFAITSKSENAQTQTMTEPQVEEPVVASVLVAASSQTEHAQTQDAQTQDEKPDYYHLDEIPDCSQLDDKEQSVVITTPVDDGKENKEEEGAQIQTHVQPLITPTGLELPSDNGSGYTIPQEISFEEDSIVDMFGSVQDSTDAPAVEKQVVLIDTGDGNKEKHQPCPAENSFLGVAFQETVFETRKVTKRRKVVHCSTVGQETRIIQKRVTAPAGIVFQPKISDTHEYVQPNIGSNWQVSRKFPAVTSDGCHVCKVVITDRDFEGTRLQVGDTSIKVGRFKALQNDLVYDSLDQAVDAGGVVARVGTLIKEMEYLGSVGNIYLYCEDPEIDFQGLSMMLAIEACFNNYDPKYLFTGDAHPRLNWLPSSPLDEEDLYTKVAYSTENGYNLVIKDVNASKAPSLADAFEFPSRPIDDITFPLYLEGYSSILDRRTRKQIIVKSDDTAHAQRIAELEQQVVDLQSRLEEAKTQERDAIQAPQAQVKDVARRVLGFDAQVPASYRNILQLFEDIKDPHVHGDNQMLDNETFQRYMNVVQSQVSVVQENRNLYVPSVLKKMSKAKTEQMINNKDARSTLIHLRQQHPALQNASYTDGSGKTYKLSTFKNLELSGVTPGTVGYQVGQLKALRQYLQQQNLADKDKKKNENLEKQLKPQTKTVTKKDDYVDIFSDGVVISGGKKPSKPKKNEQNLNLFAQLMQQAELGTRPLQKPVNRDDEDALDEDMQDIFAMSDEQQEEIPV